MTIMHTLPVLTKIQQTAITYQVSLYNNEWYNINDRILRIDD